jgi:hypothetical protein
MWSQIAILDKGNGGVTDSDDLTCLIRLRSLLHDPGKMQQSPLGRTRHPQH